jgi:hypothetical protein
MATLLAPAAGASFLTRLGNTYRADEYGVLRDVPTGTETTDLQALGCALVQPGRFPIFVLQNADLTSQNDQKFSSLLGPVNWYSISRIVIAGPSQPITAATGDIGTLPNQAGEVIASGQSFAMADDVPGEMVVVAPGPVWDTKCFQGQLYLHLTATEPPNQDGTPITCDIFVYGDVLAL